MKSQQKKRHLERAEAVRIAAEAARENNPYLMALYLAVIPNARVYREPKFSDDKYGNRVLTETLKELVNG